MFIDFQTGCEVLEATKIGRKDTQIRALNFPHLCVWLSASITVKVLTTCFWLTMEFKWLKKSLVQWSISTSLKHYTFLLQSCVEMNTPFNTPSSFWFLMINNEKYSKVHYRRDRTVVEWELKVSRTFTCKLWKQISYTVEPKMANFPMTAFSK